MTTDADRALAEANAALANTLSGGLTVTYWYADEELYGVVQQKYGNAAYHHVQKVGRGESVYDIAGKAGTWLGKNKAKLNELRIVAHGSPGSFKLGKNVDADNVAPLGGWLYSFFPEDTADTRIKLISCNAAADSNQTVGKCNVGQVEGTKGRGYRLLFNLAKASRQVVAGSLYALSTEDLNLYWTCRFVKPNGDAGIFQALGGDPFAKGYC